MATPTFAPAPEAPSRGRGLRIALAAAMALALAAAGATASLLIRAPRRLEPPSLPAPPGIAPVRISVPAAPSVPSPPSASSATPAPTSTARPQRPPRSATARESYAAELRLLQGAQIAYAEGNFTGALALAAEHSRRFPNGRLAEEREALRVRLLAASGRGAGARRALAGFARRFPRSVLLPRLQETSAMAE